MFEFRTVIGCQRILLLLLKYQEFNFLMIASHNLFDLSSYEMNEIKVVLYWYL